MPENSVLPMHFDKVARFAALELLLRGPGVQGEYAYNLRDVLTVAIALDMHGANLCSDHFSNVQDGWRRIVNLSYTYSQHQAYLQNLGTNSQSRGQTNKDGQ